MPVAKWVEFVCPECDGYRIEEVSQGVIYNSILGFYDRYPDYDETNYDNTEVIRYQCWDCGMTIIDGPTMNLFNSLLEKGYLNIPPERDEPNWEV